MSVARLYRHLPDFSRPDPSRSALHEPAAIDFSSDDPAPFDAPLAEPELAVNADAPITPQDIEAMVNEAREEGREQGRMEAEERLSHQHREELEAQAASIRQEAEERRRAELSKLSVAIRAAVGSVRNDLDATMAELLLPVAEQMLRQAALHDLRTRMLELLENHLEVTVSGPGDIARQFADMLASANIQATVVPSSGEDIEVRVGAHALRTRAGAMLRQFVEEVRAP